MFAFLSRSALDVRSSRFLRPPHPDIFPHYPLAAANEACHCPIMISASEVQSQAMKLPKRSRLKLASALLDSVAPAVRPDEILEEAARRDAEMTTGKVTPLSESEFWGGVVGYR